jgi:hypothetical protein
MRHLVVKIKACKFVIGDLISQVGVLVLSDALHQALSSTTLHVGKRSLLLNLRQGVLVCFLLLTNYSDTIDFLEFDLTIGLLHGDSQEEGAELLLKYNVVALL